MSNTETEDANLQPKSDTDIPGPGDFCFTPGVCALCFCGWGFCEEWTSDWIFDRTHYRRKHRAQWKKERLIVLQRSVDATVSALQQDISKRRVEIIPAVATLIASIFALHHHGTDDTKAAFWTALGVIVVLAFHYYERSFRLCRAGELRAALRQMLQDLTDYHEERREKKEATRLETEHKEREERKVLERSKHVPAHRPTNSAASSPRTPMPPPGPLIPPTSAHSDSSFTYDYHRDSVH